MVPLRRRSRPARIRLRLAFIFAAISCVLYYAVTSHENVSNIASSTDCHSLALLDDGDGQVEVKDQTTRLRLEAERRWLAQNGYLYMQHSRKAGGTTLCMLLRHNSKGLVRTQATGWDAEKRRETCQIISLCSDCNYKTRNWYSAEKLPSILVEAMNNSGRNFIEMEGAGVPIDLLTNPGWDSFIFVSTIRHPIERVASALRGDPKYHRNPDCPVGQLNCTKSYIQERHILEACLRGIYSCLSNYFVRMFSGRDTNVPSPSRVMLEEAKANFLRFSCVVLQEQWDETVGCLSNIGLHLNVKGRFNVDGRISAPLAPDNRKRNESYIEGFSSEEMDTLLRLNELDMEFYEWAKGFILRSTALRSRSVT
mmetsp:Transcript_33291/g.72025  ORF Transcript_33291/g.72025 Transcript_33291/m.72025 type:complete len:367 (+) Transcript_33291:248-1348(+)